MGNSTEGVTLVVCSGDMDKVNAALNIAIGAAASGKETNIFFTFWGFKAIQKGNLTGKSFFGKMLGFLNRGGISRIGPSRFNFWGIGRWMFNRMMRARNVPPMAELLQTAIDLGVKLYPCQMTMEVMEISKDDLIDGVQPVAGVASMLEMAYRSKATLFI
jgi:peroxiredoxin family protein